MNDRIEELIVAYLHRGCTPEQERELFDACKNNSEVAALLRRHVTLSLKLRSLRDEAAVPIETRNALLSRINSIPAADLPGHTPLPIPQRAAVRRFGWAHLFGTALAGAVATVAVLLLLRPSVQPTQTTDVLADTRIDTVVITKTETVTEYRDRIRRVVVPRATQPQAPDVVEDGTGAQPSPVDIALAADDPTPAVADSSVDEASSTGDHEAAPIDLRTGDAHPYLQQYNVMLASLEKVRLTPGDRIRN